MILEITAPSGPVQTEITLPSSKSISNRALIIRALGGMQSPLLNLSEADDTRVLSEILQSPSGEINAGDGGTTLRFLLAYLAAGKSEVVLTASESLKKRPVAALVDALRKLGADIHYTEEEGKLPVHIRPAKLSGVAIQISGEISSQFISALMMIGPYLPGGLELEITGEMLSLPYILMTESLMKYFGAVVTFNENMIRVNEGVYHDRELTVEPDWSAASYWYEIAALAPRSEIKLNGLVEASLQGDSAIARMMQPLGVISTFSEEGLIIKNQGNNAKPEYFRENLMPCPDLGPALAAALGALNITSDLEGLKNFRLKESDRAAAMQRELYLMNVKTDFCGGSKFKLYQSSGMRRSDKPVKTYNDHRIAMAFAPLAIVAGRVLIENPDVVKKSYPRYFHDLQKAGFGVNETG